jgi:amino acid adenylation domain-containing protein
VRTITELIARHAEATPDAIAARTRDGRITYAELEGAANAVAASIRERVHVDEATIIAVALDRSLDFLTAILGCWKAGAAYLPLDVGLPLSRLERLLDDSGASLVIGDGSAMGELAPSREMTLPIELAKRGGSSSSSRHARPTDIAYVIYTSGTTGGPRGVVVEHRHLVSYALAAAEALGIDAETSIAAASSFTTDLAYTAVFAPLAVGGTAVVLSRDISLDAAKLARLVELEEIDAIKITPSHVRALLTNRAQTLPLRRFILGGEVLHWSLVARLREASPGCEIFNHYGPTETTVGVCCYRCGEEEDGHNGVVPIGTPFDGVSMQVLDEALRPVASGDSGELVIGGPTVARGYLRRPAETSARFVHDPREGSNARMYRSGDRVQVLPDGAFQFLGRLDDQLKIRGFRVEPVEIERVLAGHSGVASSVVVGASSRAGDTTLVAGVVPERPGFNSKPLRAYAAKQLPAHMIPDRFVELPATPMLPSGKVDRSATRTLLLEWLENESAAADADDWGFVSVYRDILGMSTFAPDDDFFAAGGNSLLAVQLAGELAEKLGVQIPLAWIYLYPTAAELEQAISEPVLPVIQE